LTKKRYIGLALLSTKSENSVFILFGHGTPAALSPRHDSAWMFVGTAYIPGFMKGEAVMGLKSSIYMRETVELW
jgi:hypothetical protein